jgi:hypothetical protein
MFLCATCVLNMLNHPQLRTLIHSLDMNEEEGATS